MADVASELNWIEAVLDELGIKVERPSTVWCDNVAANYLIKNSIYHAKTKHVAINYHFVREQVATRQLQAKFVRSQDQLADILTKPLPRVEFNHLWNKLMVEPPIRLRGGVLVRFKSVVRSS